MFKLARIFTALALGLILMSCSNPTDPPFDLYGSFENLTTHADWCLMFTPENEAESKGRINYLISFNSIDPVDELSTGHPGLLYIDGKRIELTFLDADFGVSAEGAIRKTPNSVIQISFHDPETQVVRHRSSLRLLDQAREFCFAESFQQFQDNQVRWILDVDSPNQYLLLRTHNDVPVIVIPPSCRSYLLPWETMQNYILYPFHTITLSQMDYNITNRILYLSASSSYLDTESSSPQINQDKKPYLQLINSLERRIRKVNSEQ